MRSVVCTDSERSGCHHHIYTMSRRRALLEDLGWANRSPATSPSPTRCENKAVPEVTAPDLLAESTKHDNKENLDKGRTCKQRIAIQSSSPILHDNNDRPPITPNTPDNMRTKFTVMSSTIPHSPERDAMFRSLAGLGPFSHPSPQYGKPNHDYHDETSCNPRAEECKLYCRTLRHTEDTDGLFPTMSQCNTILDEVKQLLARSYSEVAAFRQIRKDFELPDVYLSKYGTVDLCTPSAIRLVAGERIAQAGHVVIPKWRLNQRSGSEIVKLQTDAQASTAGRLRRSSVDEQIRLEQDALAESEESTSEGDESSSDSPPPKARIASTKRGDRSSSGTRVDSAVSVTEAKRSLSEVGRKVQAGMEPALRRASHVDESVLLSQSGKRKRGPVDSKSPAAKKARTVSARVPQSRVEIVVTKITLRCTPKPSDVRAKELSPLKMKTNVPKPSADIEPEAIVTKKASVSKEKEKKSLVSAKKSSPPKIVAKASANIEPKVTVTKEKEMHDIERAARENVLAGREMKRSPRHIKTPARFSG